MKKSQLIGVLIILLIILLLVGIFVYKYWGKKIIENNSVANIQPEKLYKVNLSLNPGISEPKPYSFDIDYGSSELGDYLVDILQLGKPNARGYNSNIISTIAYNSMDGGSKFNREYFILLKSGSINTQRAYKTNEFTADVSEANTNLLPFILNQNYCEVDADCLVGMNFCSYASYNKFRIYKDVWGCEYPIYPQENSAELTKICTSEQYPTVKYMSSSCINNRCVAQGRKITCNEGQLP